jgi:neutral ceramidase
VTTPLRAGSARVDITPDGPVLQAGFGQRTTPSVGVHDRLFAKALYLECAGQRLLFVTTDLLCIPRPLAEDFLARLADTGLAASEICLCASHTHSGPVPYEPESTAPGVAAYAVRLLGVLERVARGALSTAVPSVLRAGVGEVDVFFNRRTRGAPNHVDRRVPALAFAAGTPARVHTVLFGAGCHPVTLGWDSHLVSADFPGVAQARVEAAHPGANALFFNTTEGNVVPVTSPNRDALDPRGYCGGAFADTERIGAAIAEAALAALETAPTIAAVDLRAARTELLLPAPTTGLDAEAARRTFDAAEAVLAASLGADFAARVPPSRLWAAASQHVIAHDLPEAEMRVLMIACCRYLGLLPRLRHGGIPRSVRMPIQVLHIADFEFLALPGEVLVEVGDAWRRGTGNARAFIVGLANGHHRYLPLAAHFAEPEAEVRYETVTAGVAAGAVDYALTQALALASR